MIQGLTARRTGQGNAFCGEAGVRSRQAGEDARQSMLARNPLTESSPGMRRFGGHWCWLAVVLVPLSWPGFAAGSGCVRATSPVGKAICASPSLSELDARLSNTYAKAVAQNGRRKAALQRDEQNWLSERDDSAWSLLGGPGTASAAVRELGRLYQERIAFLDSLDGARPLPDSPLADKLLPAVRALPPGTTNVLQALQSQGLVVLPQRRTFVSADKVITALPAPPDAALRTALERYTGVTNFTLVYLPSVHLGGVFNVEGTAGCMYWDIFDVRAGASVRSDMPGGGTGWCWNTRGHLALINGLPAAISETTGILSQETDLQWRRWRGTKWGALRWVRIRFDRVLSTGFAGCASGVDCAAARQLALRYARLYDRRPLPSTLLHVAALTPLERSRFLRIAAFAEGVGTESGPISALSEKEFQQRWTALMAQARRTGKIQTREVVMELPFANHGTQFATPRFGPQPPAGSFQPASALFPARLGGELVLGRIGHGQIGWRQYSPWMVGFWRWKGKRLVPLAGVGIDRQNGKVLLAARMSGAPPPHSP
jgi:uncharacterized protein YecT (DUF1311 family)